MTTESTTAEIPRRMTVPTTREIKAALASIPMGKGEPGLNTAVLDAAEHAKAAARALGIVYPFPSMFPSFPFPSLPLKGNFSTSSFRSSRVVHASKA